jgi:hypothetical protein
LPNREKGGLAGGFLNPIADFLGSQKGLIFTLRSGNGASIFNRHPRARIMDCRVPIYELHTSEVPFSVDYGPDDYLRRLHVIDDPIAVGDQLAQVFVVEFRHLASCTWEFLKRTREFDDSSHH